MAPRDDGRKTKAPYGRRGLTDYARRERLESGEAWLRSHGWRQDPWGDWHQGSLTVYHTWQHGWQAMGLPGGCPTPEEALARAAHRAGRESPPRSES